MCVMWFKFLCLINGSEVRVEGLDTLEYIDNKLYRTRNIEQADALTFDEEVFLFTL